MVLAPSEVYNLLRLKLAQRGGKIIFEGFCCQCCAVVGFGMFCILLPCDVQEKARHIEF